MKALSGLGPVLQRAFRMSCAGDISFDGLRPFAR